MPTLASKFPPKPRGRPKQQPPAAATPPDPKQEKVQRGQEALNAMMMQQMGGFDTGLPAASSSSQQTAQPKPAHNTPNTPNTTHNQNILSVSGIRDTKMSSIYKNLTQLVEIKFYVTI